MFVPEARLHLDRVFPTPSADGRETESLPEDARSTRWKSEAERAAIQTFNTEYSSLMFGLVF